MEPMPFVITCAVDQSEYAPAVLTHMFDLAARHGTADCHVVTAVPMHRVGVFRDAPPPATVEAERAHAQMMLAQTLAMVLDDLSVSREQRDRTWLHVRRGVAAEEIVGLAAEAGASLIVVGRFGADDGRTSVADRVIKLAECPVFVVQGSSYASTATDQCPDCVAVRRLTRGEEWFCARHHGEPPVLASTVTVGESMVTGWRG